MARLSERFWVKDFSKQLDAVFESARVFRVQDDSGVHAGDVAPNFDVGRFEVSRDAVKVRVIDPDTNSIVADCTAYLCEVTADFAMYTGVRSFKDDIEAGVYYASRAAMLGKSAPSPKFKDHTVSALILHSLNVAPQYRRQRIGTNILDLICHFTSPQVVSVVLYPVEDVQAACSFLSAYSFERKRNVSISSSLLKSDERPFFTIEDSCVKYLYKSARG